MEPNDSRTASSDTQDLFRETYKTLFVPERGAVYCVNIKMHPDRSLDNSYVLCTFTSIKVEIKPIDTAFANELLSGKNCRSLRKGVRLLCGRKTRSVKYATDADSVNFGFIQLSNRAPATFVQGD